MNGNLEAISTITKMKISVDGLNSWMEGTEKEILNWKIEKEKNYSIWTIKKIYWEKVNRDSGTVGS